MGRANFFKKFDEMMNELPNLMKGITEEVDDAIGNHSYHFYESSSTIVQGGKKIVVKTKDGKTTVTVDGKKYKAETDDGRGKAYRQ